MRNRLNEQIRRAKELMGVINEQTFECDKCRWNGTATIYQDSDRVELELRFHNHTGSKTKVIESFEWEGNKQSSRNGYRELQKKAEEVNRKYKLDIKIPVEGDYMQQPGRKK
jgi:hypothetical protein